MDDKNLESISDIKIVSLVLIILSHCMFFFDDNPFFIYKGDVMSPSVSFVVRVLDAILVPGYVFCSGYLFALGQKGLGRSSLEVIKVRAKRLLIPYYLYGALWLVPLYTYFDINSFGRPDHSGYLDGYRTMILGQFSDHLWFLWMLFDVSVIFALLRIFIKKGQLVITGMLTLATALVVSLFLQDFPYFKVSQIAPYLITFFVGVCFSWYSEKTKSIPDKVCLATALGLLVIICLYVFYKPEHWAVKYVMNPAGALFEFFMIRSVVFAPFWKRYKNTAIYKYQADTQMEFYLLHMPVPILVFRLLNPYFGRMPWVCVFLDFVIVIFITAVLVQLKRWVTKPVMPFWNSFYEKDRIRKNGTK